MNEALEAENNQLRLLLGQDLQNYTTSNKNADDELNCTSLKFLNSSSIEDSKSDINDDELTV